MDDSDKIRVLMIYFDHFGRQDIQARKRCMDYIMTHLKSCSLIDIDMTMSQFTQWLLDQFHYHLSSAFQVTVQTMTDMLTPHYPDEYADWLKIHTGGCTVCQIFHMV